MSLLKSENYAGRKDSWKETFGKHINKILSHIYVFRSLMELRVPPWFNRGLIINKEWNAFAWSF